jgi:hypothetical protein
MRDHAVKATLPGKFENALRQVSNFYLQMPDDWFRGDINEIREELKNQGVQEPQLDELARAYLRDQGLKDPHYLKSKSSTLEYRIFNILR